MTKKWNILIAIVALFAIVGICTEAQAFESKYAAHATASAVSFGPGSHQTFIKNIWAKSDKAGSVLTFYTRSGAPVAPTAVATNGALIISVANTGNVLTTNDVVQYVHANGLILQTTVASNTDTTVTLATGLTQAGAAGDRIYELSSAAVFPVGAGTLSLQGDALWVSPANSPVYATLDSNTNGYLAITVDK